VVNEQLTADDPVWTDLISMPLTIEDVFAMIYPDEIRKLVRENLENLQILVTVCFREIDALDIASNESIQRVRNCIKILTRVMPFTFEFPD
jgi:hypothetical protein